MRWPNDVLHGARKLAGLLVDRFGPATVVVGIGINVSNDPEGCDAGLRGQTCRLADLLSPAPSLHALTRALLQSLESTWTELSDANLAGLLKRINALWCASRVRLELDDHALEGQFGGVDCQGKLRLHLSDGQIESFEPHQVRLLREIT